MNASSRTALQQKHTATASELYMAFELGEKNWKLALSDGARTPSRYTVTAGDTAGLLECIAKTKARCGLPKGAKVRSCYEAGRDGFWLHRWLIEQGIDNIVVDSASIEVNRRARRAKTDRLDGDKLLTMLLRYTAGERRVWSLVRVPTPQQEDQRRVHRELERLGRERSAHSNRIRALLVMHNLRVKYVGGRLWQRWWAAHAGKLPPGVGASDRARERAAVSGAGADAHDRGAAAPGGGRWRRGAGGAACAAGRHRGRQRLGVGEGAVWLAPLS